ncbi:MAG: LysR substrate-binding domain-containing protein [Hydrogenophaga sp.]|nr:LysR substrate-binding domain-containing protein [Hydrogenophaga sp.]MDO9435450.1 LysR substrate-binding domain-containing protein [Hydrogenophaga sp.]
MRTLDLELLRTFVAVVDGESFAAGAQAVARTQSAVTQQMQRLEAAVGKPLFRRVGRGKQPTADGLHVLSYARRLLALNDEACRAVSGAAFTGEIRLGSPHDVTDTILPNLLSHVSTVFPGLRVAIHVGRSPHLLDSVRRGEIDMTIAAVHAPDMPGQILRTSPIVWMCAPTYRHDPTQPLPLIVADEISFFRRLAIEHLDRAHVPWRITYTSPTIVGVRAAVRAGLGVTARSVETLGHDLRMLGDEAGLPRLPDVSFRLYMAPNPGNPLVLQLYDSLAYRSL